MGNKCDMEPRSVTEEMGKKRAEELKIDYYETSALNGQGIKEDFEGLIRDIMKKKELGKEIMMEVELHLMEKRKKIGPLLQFSRMLRRHEPHRMLSHLIFFQNF